jgi:hypothetical protein
MDAEHFIECERFGGKRPAPACVHFDRFKTCRRWCTALRKHMEKTPSFLEKVTAIYSPKKESTTEEYFQHQLFMPRKHSGKGIPDPELGCKICKFVAKSPRGLRTHMTRTHKV